MNTNKFLQDIGRTSLCLLLLSAAFTATALADEVWKSNVGSIEYEKDIGTTAVFSYSTPGVANSKTRLFIDGLVVDVNGSTNSRGSYSGYWIDDSPRQRCEASLVSPLGVGSRSWGRLEISFKKQGSWWAWTAQLGDCFEQPTRKIDAVPDMADSSDYLITENSVGEIRVGMTLDEAKKSMSQAQFAAYDCDCAGEFDSISISRDSNILMTLLIDDESQRINGITSRDPSFRIANGVRAGMEITSAEQIYGKFERLYTAYDTEFVEFKGQPSGLRFIVTGKNDSEAGDYTDWKGGDPREKYAEKYTSGAYIIGIAVSGAADIEPVMESSEQEMNYLITSDSAGDIRMGMTIAQARKAMSGARFARTSDGEGLALVSVGNGDDTYMTLYAGEEDSDAPIDENAKIEYIEVWHSRFKTADGVHVKMKVSEVEAIYGKVTNIIRSEIESREYADFTRGPKGLTFRLSAVDNEAGVYPKDKSETKKYNTSAYVMSISIAY
jgi:hypothetical protein